MGRLFGLGGGDRKVFEFKCSECDAIHRGSPSFSVAKPVYYFDVAEAERQSRITLSSDTCVIEPADGSGDDPVFAIRTILEIPIHDVDEPFTWGVWVSQSRESFERYQSTYGQDQSGAGSFGWLALTLPYYETRDDAGYLVSLACNVRWGKAGERPILELHDCDHELFRDQRDGISWDKAVHIARLVMHGR